MANTEFPLQHPLKNDDVDTLMKKLRLMVRTMENFHPQETKDKGLIGIHSLVAAMISLAAEVYDALQKDRVFVACSLTCQMIELEIQLLWLNKHFYTNGVDYIDFGYVEQIDMLRVHPERADRVLELIKQNKCERFLVNKPKDDNLLNKSNYRQHWYPGTIKSISNECFEVVWNKIKNIPELAKYYDHVDVNYENYQLFCGFKHFSTYCVRKCFATSQSFVEDTPQDTRWITLVTVLQVLLSICIILEDRGDPILHVKAIATEGLKPASVKKTINNEVF